MFMISRIDLIGQNGNEGEHYMSKKTEDLPMATEEEEEAFRLLEEHLLDEEEKSLLQVCDELQAELDELGELDELDELLTDRKFDELFDKISAPSSRAAADTMFDQITKPSHYDLIPEKGVQAIDVIRAALSREEFRGYCKGNILKYALRAGQKFNEPSAKDLRKARQYIDFYLEE